MASVEAIPIPLPHVGSVNAWLLRGEPLTVVDTGPRSDQALDAIERGLRLRGVRVEDIELVIGTHHHHDHVGLAATIKRRSGARIAVLGGDRRLRRALSGARRAGSGLRARADARPRRARTNCSGRPKRSGTTSAPRQRASTADVRLQDGDRIRAGGRELRVVARPGHSATDTLLIDPAARMAFVGDHLLAEDLAQHRDLQNGRREPVEAAYRLPEQPQAYRPDATPAAAPRTRTGRCRARARLSSASSPSTADGAGESSRILERGPGHRVRGSAAPVARGDRRASSRCWSCGRCSGIST